MERDYCTSLPSEDEPDENEQWRPLRPDGTEWSSPPKADSDQISSPNLARYPPTRTNAISCFNAAGALAVIINRVSDGVPSPSVPRLFFTDRFLFVSSLQIITNIYAIRVRVLGQSSETLLSLLDQSLASWYLALPPHLAYNPAAKKVPPPHVSLTPVPCSLRGADLSPHLLGAFSPPPVLLCLDPPSSAFVSFTKPYLMGRPCMSLTLFAQHSWTELRQLSHPLPVALDLHDFRQCDRKVRLKPVPQGSFRVDLFSMQHRNHVLADIFAASMSALPHLPDLQCGRDLCKRH